MAAAGPAKAMQDRTPDTAGTAAAVPVSIASFDAPLPVPPVAAATPEPAVATAAKLLESAEADTADSDAAQGQMSISCADAVSSKTYRVGFRTIELVRLPIPQAVQDLFPPGAHKQSPFKQQLLPDTAVLAVEYCCEQCSGHCAEGIHALSMISV